MKIAILSDIHGNFTALKLVLEDIAKQKVEEIYSLGDQVGFFIWEKAAEDFPWQLPNKFEDLLKR